jgi:hypothetical protein
MHRALTPALSFLALAFAASQAHAEVVVTHARDYGFFANWGNVSIPCQTDPNRFQFISAALNFSENMIALDGTQRPIAVLNLSFANDCPDSDSGVPFSAGGVTDPGEYPFPWNFQQSFFIDKAIGHDGVLAFATYRASIPIFVDSHGCYMLATVNVRLDQQGPPQTIRNLSRTTEDGTTTFDFFRMTSRVALPSGTISVGPLPGETCNPGTLPTNFAIYPQVRYPDNSPASLIYRTRDLQITRTRP